MSYAQVQAERRRLLDAGRRLWLGDDDDLAVAQHEAGHILCGWLCHLNPVAASIDGGAGFGGKTSFGRASSKMTDCDRAFAEAVCRMAGSESERLFGSPDDGGKTDLIEARAALASLISRSEVSAIGQFPGVTRKAEVDVLVGCARSTARSMLKANLGSLIAVAVALISKRTLDQDEIKELLATSMPDEDEIEATNFGDPILTRVLDTQRVRHGAPGSIL